MFGAAVGRHVWAHVCVAVYVTLVYAGMCASTRVGWAGVGAHVCRGGCTGEPAHVSVGVCVYAHVRRHVCLQA